MSLLTMEGVDRERLDRLLDFTEAFRSVLDRPIPKVPALQGATVATMFFEPSTRTRLSFERAAKALSADVVTFNPGTSSVSKGESLKDTALTIEAMGADLMIVRHRAVGAPERVDGWVRCPVVNAGDGAHQHPTQALLDAAVIRARFGALEGLTIGIVGDVHHSRVARSAAAAWTTLGARVILIGPRTLLPPVPGSLGVEEHVDLDAVLSRLDVVYLLRVQIERGGATVFPSLPEYVRRFGLTPDRFRRLHPEAVVMHPGPMNRGVEIAGTVADDPRCLVLDQVEMGVAARMAVLFEQLAPGKDVP